MSLQNLPLDVYVCIFYFMDPIDILFLGETCASLRKATRDKSLWKTIADRAFTRNRIFSRAIQTHNMGLEELEDIQDAATAPCRVLSKLRRGGPPDADVTRPVALTANEIRLIRGSDLQPDPRVSFEEFAHKDWPKFERVWVVPGGRFIVAQRDWEIVLYDSRDLTPVKCIGQPLRARYLDPSDVAILSSSANRHEVRVAVRGDRLNPNPIIVLRFVFGDKANEAPHIVKHQTVLKPAVQGQHAIQVFTLTRDFLICVYTTVMSTTHDVVCVWNYIQDTFAIWRVERNDYRKIYYDNDHVVLMTTRAIRGWHVPEFYSRNDHPRIYDVPPTFVVPFECNDADVDADNRAQIETLSDWYNADPPSFFDLTSSSQLKHTWHTFKVKDSNTIDNYLASKKFAYDSETEYPVNRQAEITLHSYSLCNDYVIKVFLGRPRRIFVLTSPVPGTVTSNPRAKDSPKPEVALTELVLPQEYEFNSNAYQPNYFSFDPVSGKLAYLWGKDRQSIVVLDYLKHPTKSVI